MDIDFRVHTQNQIKDFQINKSIYWGIIKKELKVDGPKYEMYSLRYTCIILNIGKMSP